MQDVIIIGGGPTGSHIARRLAEKGHGVLVLEKRTGLWGKGCCTGIVGLECVDTFEIDDKAIIRQVNSATLFSPSGDTLHLQRKEPQAVILDRTIFDRSMAEKAQRAGAEYQFSSRVSEVIVGSDRADVIVTDGILKNRITARAAIIAGGFVPLLNRDIGFGTYKDMVMGVQAEVDAPGLKEAEVYFGDMAPGFFSWLVPTVGEKARAGLLSRRDAGAQIKRWLKQLAEQGKIESDFVPLDYGAIPLKPPKRTYGERIIAVGDAAGQVKPTTGGGIFYGLIGAEIAADVLHRALVDNDLSEKRLARYERAWRRKLGGELRTGYWARKLFERMSERQIDRFFKIIKAGGIDEALLKAKDLSFDWHSRTIMSLLKYRMITRTLKGIKLPFKSNTLTDNTNND